MRWSSACLEKLARLGRLLIEAFKGRESEVCWGGLRVVWVLCGLVNFKSPKNNIGLGQIRDHVPHRLIYFFVQGYVDHIQFMSHSTSQFVCHGLSQFISRIMFQMTS